VLGVEDCEGSEDSYFFGGGGGGRSWLADGPAGEAEASAGGLAISGGRGGTGGGIDVGCVGKGVRGCLDTTGGSLAKTSRRIAKKSRIFDFYSRL
jgi:hypothetical protein